jgi:hypothetical protein
VVVEILKIHENTDVVVMNRLTRKAKRDVQSRIKTYPFDKDQVIHCISQLKRFAPCIHTNSIRAAKFFYNLGRLQELLGETKHPELWWKPIEKIITDGNYALLSRHTDSLKVAIGVTYDITIVNKGC